MNCPQPTDLQRLIDDALPADQAAAMQAHLEACAACQRSLERLAAGAATWDKTAQNLGENPTRKETALFDAVEKLQEAAKSVDQTRSEIAAVPGDLDLSFLQPSQKPGSLGRLDEFDILSVVGKGGFGIVLKAFDENLHRIVAIKVMLPHMAANGTARQRFIKEARAAAPITHENVVTIHSVKGDAKIPYLAMQFVSGQTLNEKIDKSGPLGVKEILRIGMQMAEGLAAAHKQGLVHRDIKPANILLENGVERVKITDFGLARSVDDSTLTQSGTVAGTPMYMSPEQANGDSIDHRSDLFSLGSVLYVMCTGRAPFRANSTLAVLKRVADETPTPIREVNADIPDWLCDIVTKLHAKKPNERYQTAKEVAEVLGQHLANLQRSNSPPISRRIHALDAKSELTPSDAWNMYRRNRGLLGWFLFLACGIDVMAGIWLGIAGYLVLAALMTGIGIIGFGGVWRFMQKGQLPPDWVRPGPAPAESPQARFWNPRSLAGIGLMGSVVLGVMWYIGIDVPSICIAAMMFFGGLAMVAFGVAPLYQRGRWLLPQALLYGVIVAGAAVVWIRHTTPATLSLTFRHPDAIVVVEGQDGKREFRSEKPGHTQTNADFAPGLFRMTVTVYGEVTQTEEFTLAPGDFKEWILEPRGQVQVVNLSKEKISIRGPGSLDPDTKLPPFVHIGPNSAGSFPSLVGAHHWYRSGERGDYSKVAGEFVLKQGKTFLLNVSADADPEKEWVQLFNKKDLTGWATEKPKDWNVENGVLTGSGGKLRSDNEYENFELRAEVKLPFPGTADLCFRSTKLDWAYAPLGNKWLSECTGSLAYMPKNQKTQLLVDYSNSRASEDNWLQLAIRVEGKTAAVRLNGVLTAEADIAEMAPRGFIEWHVDGEKKLEVRKLEIRELPTTSKRDDTWVALFNGQDLSGWKKHAELLGDWKVEGGQLIGKGPGATIRTDRTDFSNFHLRVECKYTATEGHLWIRHQGATQLPGYQIYMRNRKGNFHTGALVVAFENKAQTIQVREERTKQGEWFILEVIARGNQIQTYVQGEKALDFTDTKNHYAIGAIQLGVPGNEGELYFKKIEIKELAAPKDPKVALSGRKAELHAIGVAYHEYSDKHRKAPSNAGDLQPFLTKNADAWKTLGDGSLIFLYNVNVLDFLPDASKFVLAYDKKTPENGGMVLMADGFVKEVSAPEFKRLPLATPIPRAKAAVAPFDAKSAKDYQDDWAKHLGVEVETKNSVGMKFRLIPPGEYDRGATENEKDATEHEMPRHRVVIQKAFYLSVTEVTSSQMKEVVGPRKGVGDARPDHPAVRVSWHDAVHFCKLLNERAEERKAGRSYRLVADAEWEYACRAGTIEPYYFGSVDNISAYAWIQGNSRGVAGDETKKVGTRKANAWGLHDMIGNVHEWCADEYLPYEKDKVEHNPHKPVEMTPGDNHVVRYSSIMTAPKNARSAARMPMHPSVRNDYVGFRVVMIGGFKD